MNSMVLEVHSLPALLRDNLDSIRGDVGAAFDRAFCRSLERLYLVGCGDSHHAALTTGMAFEALTNLPVEPMTAMQFARYTVENLPSKGRRSQAVLGVSVSGEVARTVEALMLARQAGLQTIVLTGAPGSRVAQAAERVLVVHAPTAAAPAGAVTPGVASYAANQLALFLTAVHMGEQRGVLTLEEADRIRGELAGLEQAAQRTVEGCDRLAQALARDWADAREFVFLGAGPNFGTALFSAAKVLEASGDSASGQDTEEWAHLQYFARARATPTFIISAGERDLSRAVEVAQAARAIGRRVVAVAPLGTAALLGAADVGLPLAAGVREMFSPLVAAIPGELFASYRAVILGVPFFRAFRGGRSPQAGGGVNRIRTSEILPTE